MGKTIIMSEEQVERLTEGGFSYFGSKETKHLPDNEVSSENQDASPEIGDDIAKSIVPKSFMGNTTGSKRSNGAIITCSRGFKKKSALKESNSELEGRRWKIDPTTMSKLESIYASSRAPEDSRGRMRLKGLIDDGYVNYSQATSIKSDMDRELRSGDGDEVSPAFQEMGGYPLYRFIKRRLDLETGTIRIRKENEKNRGKENVYQKPGGRKNNITGKAHTPKNGNIIVKH